MATTMHVPVQVVHSRVVYYQPCLVDLRWSRSIHSCDVCPSFTGSSTTSTTATPLSSVNREDDTPCSAIHYGLCTPVKSAPFRPGAGGGRTASSRLAFGGGLDGAPPLPAKKRRINVPITVKVVNKNTTPPIPPVSVPTKIAVPIKINRVDRVSTAVPITITKIDSSSEDSFLRQKEAELKLKREREGKENKENVVVKEFGEKGSVAKGVATSAATVSGVVNKEEAVTPAKVVTPVVDNVPASKPIKRVEDAVITELPVTVPMDTFVPIPADTTKPSIPEKIVEDIIVPPVSDSTPTPVAMETTDETEVIPAKDSLEGKEEIPRVTDTATKLPTDTAAASEIKKPDIVAEPQPLPPAVEVEPARPSPPPAPEPEPVPEVPDLKPSALPRGLGLLFGRPPLSDAKGMNEEEVMGKVKSVFEGVENGQLTKQNMKQLVKACGFPLYWKQPLFHHLGGDTAGHVTLPNFITAWKKLWSECADETARFVRITSRSGQDCLVYDDLLPLIQDVVDTHPGLTFLLSAPEFHSRYVQTVIARIFYYVTTTWSERISSTELRRSRFLQTIRLLEKEDDINRITDFFSYEHFYVIYCKFWELDRDHDLMISRDDLAKHNDHAISARMVDRIFSGAVTKKLIDGKMTYRDFVWFLISEEDKRHPRSIEYWFRCMDLDGDGIISMYEMEYFYEEQLRKMEMLGVEILPYPDCVSQMFDMIRPRDEGKIHLMDLKRCELPGIFYDTFFNLEKYLEQEQKDPFARLHDDEDNVISDWERYAAIEYDRLVAEEGGGSSEQAGETIQDEECEAEDREIERVSPDRSTRTDREISP